MSKTNSINNKSIVGIEFIGDLKKCDSAHLKKIRKDALKKKVSKLVDKYTFTELGSYYRQFDTGLTGVIALSESHVAFHTWSEKQYVSLNVFICNYSTNNAEKAKNLFNDLINLFAPEIVEKKELIRKFV
ncbi:MAG: S-adenosylmethionine decarboxylase [Patescibacteria group bacterium]